MIVRKCAKPGCDTLVVGGFCLEHEVRQAREFVRGRPFVRAELAPTVLAARPATATTTMVSVIEGATPGFTKAGGRLPSSA